MRPFGSCPAPARPSASRGRGGDDSAVTRVPGTELDQVFTTDPVIEGMHFTADDPPFFVGNKAAGRVLSDLAAMGAQPQWMLVNVVAPRTLEFRRLEQIYDGLMTVTNRFGASVIGGDMAEGPCLELHVFGSGTLPRNKALLRSGAKPGDAILVSGALGGSIKGRHLTFVPRVEEGLFLRESGVVTAMMDISDGLATDLRHMLNMSHAGALLQAASIPLTAEAESFEHALYDGEDFELLFTVPMGRVDALRREWASRFDQEFYLIGRVVGGVGDLVLEYEDGRYELLDCKAFEHYVK
jgi:thiamine-monophosphate kinase